MLFGFNHVSDSIAAVAGQLDFVASRLRAALRLRSQRNWQSLLVLSHGDDVILDLPADEQMHSTLFLWRLRAAVLTALLALVGCSVVVWSTGLK